MKYLKRFVKVFIIGFALLVAFLYFSGYDYIFKAIGVIYGTGHTTAYLEDYKAFDNRVIEKSNQPLPWPIHKRYNEVKQTIDLESWHERTGTVAYLIILNDSIWHESYYDGIGRTSKTNSFSMAKTMVTLLMQKAIQDGSINNLNQPVGDFFPEFSKNLAARMTIGDLSSMASGLNWDESYYSPFSVMTRAYFDDNLPELMLDRKVITEPGEKFTYYSGNTQLLGMVVEKASGKKLARYLQEAFWQPLGTETGALWQLDSKESDTEKAYCCIAGSARDFARFGKLLKDHGKWMGKQLIDSSFVAMATRPRFEDSPQYGYGMWLSSFKSKQVFYLRGHLGQYVCVIPNDNLIVVRLGDRTVLPTLGHPHRKDFYAYIEGAYKMLEDADKN